MDLLLKAWIVTVGRFLFFVLIIIQGLALAAYLAAYENHSAWNSFALLFLPASLFWWYISVNNAGKPKFLFFTWLSYVWLGLVPMIGVVFGIAVDKLYQPKGFLNPSTLQMSLCITPLLLLLLFHTGMESTIHRKTIVNLSIKAAIDLVDAIELLSIVIDEIDTSHDVPKSVEKLLISFACISILCQSVLGIPYDEKRLEEGGDETEVSLANSLTQVLLNTVFLGLRLGLIFNFNRVASLFIAKNIVMIVGRLFELKYLTTLIYQDVPTNEPASDTTAAPAAAAPSAGEFNADDRPPPYTSY